MRQLHAPLPRVLALTEEFILNTDLLNLLESDETDIQRLQKLVEKVKEESFNVDRTTLNFMVSTKVNAMMRAFSDNAHDPFFLETAESLLRILHPLSLNLDLWESQNIYFSVGKQLLAEMEEKAERGNDQAKAWMAGFQDLGDYLGVRIV